MAKTLNLYNEEPLKELLKGINLEYFMEMKNGESILEIHRFPEVVDCPNSLTLQKKLETVIQREKEKMTNLEEIAKEHLKNIEIYTEEITKNKKKMETIDKKWDASNYERQEYNNLLDLVRRLSDKREAEIDRRNECLSKIEDTKNNLEDLIDQKTNEIKESIEQEVASYADKFVYLLNDLYDKDYILYLQCVFILRNYSELCLNSFYSLKPRDLIKNLKNAMQKEIRSAVLEHELEKALLQKIKILKDNESLYNEAKKLNNDYPTDQINHYLTEFKQALDYHFTTNYQYKEIIDPTEINKMKKEMENELNKQNAQNKYYANITQLNQETMNKIISITQEITQLVKQMEENVQMGYHFIDDFVMLILHENLPVHIMTSHEVNQIKELTEKVQVENVSYSNMNQLTDTNHYYISDIEKLHYNDALSCMDLFNRIKVKMSQLSHSTKTLQEMLLEIEQVPKEHASKFQEEFMKEKFKLFVPLVNHSGVSNAKATLNKYYIGVTSGNEHFRHSHDVIRLILKNRILYNLILFGLFAIVSIILWFTMTEKFWPVVSIILSAIQLLAYTRLQLLKNKFIPKIN